LSLSATVAHTDGHTYAVTSSQPMVDDPLGRFTTWWGVGMNVWHHGRSGIGTSIIPATESEVAVFALGTLTRDGTPIAAGVPVHVMTMDDGKAELDVGDPTTPLPGVPDGHLRVMWEAATVTSTAPHVSLYVFGSVVLFALLVLAGTGLRLETSEPMG
jgi:hypothetical protein